MRRAFAWSAAVLAAALAAPTIGARQADDGPTAVRAVRALLEAGRYEQADAAASLLPVEGIPTSTVSAVVRELQIEARLRNGRGADSDTLTLARSLVPQRTTTSTDPDLGRRLRLLGRVLLDAGHYSEASAQFALARNIHERTRGRLDVEVAEDLDGLAEAWTWRQRYPAALALADRALAIKERAGLGRGMAVARTLAIRGLIRLRQADKDGARADVDRAMTIGAAVRAGHPESLPALVLYADCLQQAGDAAASYQALKDAAAARALAALRRDHPVLADAARATAMAAFDLGKFDEAKLLREESLVTAERAYGSGHPLVGLHLNDLATSLTMEGDYIAARRLQTRALQIYEARLGPAHGYVITAVYNLGVLDFGIGDFEEAARMHTRAVALWERAVGPAHPYVAWGLSGLADSLASLGRPREAVRYYERALRIRERSLGPRSTRVARTLSNLSKNLVSLGATARADALSARAVSIWEEAASPDGLTEALLVRARVESQKGRPDLARAAYERVIALRLPLFGAAHPTIAEAEAGLAATLAALDRPADARAAALRAERIGRDHLRLTVGALPERQALAYAASRPRGLDLALSLIVDTGSASEVYDALVRSRAVVLDEMATRQRLRASTSATASLGSLWSELASARRKLANLAVRGPADDSGQRYAAEIDGARREKERLEAALAQGNAGLRQELTRKEVGLPEVLTAVPARSAVVSFVRYLRAPKSTPSYMAFVLRAGDASPTPVFLGSAKAIEDAVALWRKHVPSGLRDDGTMIATAEASLRMLGESLRRKVWTPLAPLLADVDHVFVVPEADLNLVPFAALPTGRSSYLIDARYTLHYLSAERDLLAFTTTARAAGRGLLAVGGPAYGTMKAEAPVRLTVRGVSVSTGPAVPQCVTLQSLSFGELPAAVREAQELAGLWRHLRSSAASDEAPALSLIGPAATEVAFTRAAAGRRILHLATHGFFLGECAPSAVAPRPARPPGAELGATASSSLARSPLVFSGLALAGANRRQRAVGGGDDGILTAEEVAGLDLNGVEWAVLSACDTGLGTIKTGEGVFGLRRAFEVAGARTVIMSLWSVEDRASRAWMRALYDGRLRGGLSTAEALREASRAVLRERRARGLGTHPLFWAGFVAAGDWR